jgi:WD40 repeat protein
MPIQITNTNIAKIMYGNKEIEKGLLWKLKNIDPIQQEVFDVLPPVTVNGLSYSPDGTYLAVGHDGSPFITIYKRSGDTFTKLTNPATLPANFANGVAFSPDGTYLAVAHSTSPFITIYKRSGDTFTKLTDPATLPPSTGFGTAFSPDGTYLAVAHGNSPFITIYKRDGDTFTKLANPDILPTEAGFSVSFGLDDTYLAVGHLNTPRITIYKRSGDTFTKLPDPDILPTGFSGRDVVFSTDGTYLAVVHNTTPFVTIYKRSGDTFTKLPNPDILPTGISRAVVFSPGDNYLAVGHSNEPYLSIYRKEGDDFIFDNPDASQLPASDGYAVAYSPNKTNFAFGAINAPTLINYKVAQLKQTAFYSRPLLFDTYRLIGDIELEANTTSITFDNLPALTGNNYNELLLVYEIIGSSNGNLRVYQNSDFNNGNYHSVNVQYDGTSSFRAREVFPRFSFIDGGEIIAGEAVINNTDTFAFMSKTVRGTSLRIYNGNVASNGGIGPVLNRFSITGPMAAGSKFKLYEVIK